MIILFPKSGKTEKTWKFATFETGGNANFKFRISLVLLHKLGKNVFDHNNYERSYSRDLMREKLDKNVTNKKKIKI